MTSHYMTHSETQRCEVQNTIQFPSQLFPDGNEHNMFMYMYIQCVHTSVGTWPMAQHVLGMFSTKSAAAQPCKAKQCSH